jgi:NADH dehydrogenase FAD-containing subunit
MPIASAAALNAALRAPARTPVWAASVEGEAVVGAFELLGDSAAAAIERPPTPRSVAVSNVARIFFIGDIL